MYSYYKVKIDNNELPNVFTLDELLENGLLDDYDVNILVKQDSDQDWTVAREYPFSQTESGGVYTINESESVTRKVSNMGNYSVNEDGSVNRHRPQKPSSNMVWAILCTLFCCIPFGIAAIINAAKVDGLYHDGDYAGALEAANKAKNYALYGAIIGGIVSVIYFFMGMANA